MIAPNRSAHKSVASDIISLCKISAVYHALSGKEPRWTGRKTWRGNGFYRDGDNPDAVSGNDIKNTYFDHVEGSGGGILSLICRARGGSNQDALRWLAEFAGVDLDDKPLTGPEKAQFSQQRRRIDQLLPKARMWCRVAIVMTEGVLDAAKDSLFDPVPDEPRADISDLPMLTKQLARLKRLDGEELVTEFEWWQEQYPELTSAILHSAIIRAAADQRALEAFLAMTYGADAA